MRRIIVLGVLLSAGCGRELPNQAATSPITSPVQSIKEQFVTAVSRGWDSFEVCEHRTRSDRRDFFVRALELDSTADLEVLETTEVTVRRDSGSPGLHLGIAELQFSSPEQAARLRPPDSTATSRFLAGTPILTRYVTVLDNRRILVAYSETHLRSEVQQFLQELEK